MNIIEELKNMNIGQVVTDALLKDYTTYKVGGKLKCLVYPKDENALINLISKLKSENIKYMILGLGSNVLFSDKDYDGVIIKLDNFKKLEFSNNKVIAGAGVSLIKLATETFKKELSGLEFAAGIPGSVGGSVYMNAGAYKSDMSSVVSKIKVLTPSLEIKTMTTSELDFEYRSSFLKKNKDYICLEVEFELKKENKDEIYDLVEDRRIRRFNSQPLEFPSAGSVFRNPENMFSGKLIEDLGLKGLIKGGAKISEKHANFIINFNNASANDIKYLIDYAKKRVKENYDVDLVVEQELINW